MHWMGCIKMKIRGYNKIDLLINKRSKFLTKRLYLKFHGKANIGMKKYKKERCNRDEIKNY